MEAISSLVILRAVTEMHYLAVLLFSIYVQKSVLLRHSAAAESRDESESRAANGTVRTVVH